MKIKSFFSWLNIVPFLISISLFVYAFYASNIHLATPIFILVIYLSFLFIFLNHSAYLIEPSFKNLKNTINQYIFRNSYKYNGKEKAIGNIDKFIEDEYEEFRNDSIAKLAPSVFPILGIFFTFASIALFMPDFSSKNADGLNNEITDLLQGVGTAFYASMYGLFMLLWWQYFEQRGMDKILEKLLSLRKQFEHNFWSKEEIELIKLQQQKGLENSFENSIKTALSPEFVNKLNDKLTGQLENLSRIISTETDIHKNLLEQFNKLTIFQSELMSRQEKLIETHDGILKNNHDLIEKQQDGLKHFEQINKTIYENLSKLFTSLDISIEKLEVFSSKSESLVSSFNSVEESIKESKYNIDAVSSLTDSLEQLTNKIEDMNESYNSIVTTINESFKEIVSQNSQVKEIFADKVDLISKSSSSLVEYSKSLSLSIDKIDLEKFSSNMQSVNKNIDEIKITFGKTSTELKESIQLFNDNITDKIKEVFKTIDVENSQVLDRLLSGFKDVQKYNAKFEDSVDTLTSEFALLNEQLSALNEKKKENN